MPRQPLPGNEDLAHLIPPDPPTRRWEPAVMVAITVVVVAATLIVVPQFERFYRELGIQLPARTQDILGVWFHLVALGALAVPCWWRFHVGRSALAVTSWSALILIYVIFVTAALLLPLDNVMWHLGEKTG